MTDTHHYLTRAAEARQYARYWPHQAGYWIAEAERLERMAEGE